MKSTFKKITAACILSLGSMTANAAVISYGDYSWDDTNNYVTNENSGLQWLRWTETGGQSINDALLSHEADGYRLASNTEMADLFSGYFTGRAWTADVNQSAIGRYDGDDSAYTAFLNMFGKTAQDNYCWDNIANYDCLGDHRSLTVAVYGDDADGDGLYNHSRVYDESKRLNLLTNEYKESPEAAYFSSIGAVSRTTSNEFTGVALVRDLSVSEVPEPASLSLLSLGLVGLGFARRQKKS